MTIYRGPGGTGSATSDVDTTEFQEFLVQSQAARDAALAAQTAAELAETNAETAETNAETAETNAETAAANASSSASAASSSATAASTSATNAASSASSASTSASSASASASAAAASASAALTSENNAETAETNAAASASAASSSASTATTQASNAAASATAAAGSASSASTSATNAANSASSASTSASSAATSATNAASSATAAASSATAAAASAASINPADIVHISGTETITGAKTFSQTITGSITGNAGTATNGVVTTGSYADPTWITSLAGSKVSGNISGNAGNVTGTVAVTNGGTGSTTASAARTALGVAIGTDVQAYSPNLSAYASTGIGFRNRIINGGAQIAQRGSVSISTNSAVYGGCDRWLTGISGFSTVSTTAAQAGSSGSSASITGFVQQIGPTNTTGSGVVAFQQRIESFNTADLNSKSVTVTLTLYQDTGSTLSPTLNLYKPTAQDNWLSSTFIAGTSVSLPSGVRTSFTWTTTLGASDATNGLSLQINIPCGAITGKYFQLGDVQLEAGTVATPFERRPYGTELALCQRYYQYSAMGSYSTTTYIGSIMNWTVPMRTSPTVLFNDQNGNTSKVNTTNGPNISITGGGISGNFLYLQMDAILAASAGNWWRINFTASAEL